MTDLGRRQALLATRDLLVAAAATSAFPALAQTKAPAATPGPLNLAHGFADLQGITLWMQGVRPGTVRVEIRAEGATGAPLQALRAELDPRADNTAAVRIVALEAGTLHRYTVHPAEGREVLASGAFRTQVHWQYRGDPPAVRIAAGSCAYLNDFKYDRPGTPYGGNEEIFDTIAAASPDLMLWLGDNIYLRDPEWTSREGTSRRYRFHRAHERLRRLWQAAPHVAIWDDHDFGPNNSDASFSNRAWAQEVFRRYWPAPYAGPGDGGLYGQVTQGDVDLFLLDGRSYRYPRGWPDAAPEKALYGAAQVDWLKRALTFSRAPFKLVAGGSQFWNRASRGDSWAARYPAEAGAFRKWLDESRIPGVIFLSGDRHFAHMLKLERGALYPIHEVTTSPLTSGVVTRVDREELESPDVVPGTWLHERNFAFITVTGPRLQRALSLEIRDAAGAKRWEWKTTAAELGAPQRSTSPT